MYRFRTSQSRSCPVKALAEHRHTILAIEQGDEEFTEMLMRRHISMARKIIEQQVLAEEA